METDKPAEQPADENETTGNRVIIPGFPVGMPPVVFYSLFGRDTLNLAASPSGSVTVAIGPISNAITPK